jgi:hypothetical protein
MFLDQMTGIAGKRLQQVEGTWKVYTCDYFHDLVHITRKERKLHICFWYEWFWNFASAGSKRDAEDRLPAKNLDADDSDAEAKSDSDER